MKQTLATASLAAALGLALAVSSAQAQQAGMTREQQQVQERMEKFNLEKCYGIAARGMNDCAEGARSCVGQATHDRDRSAFLLVPKGDCQRIAGGSLTPA
jgi:uncharacterized membrane protein